MKNRRLILMVMIGVVFALIAAGSVITRSAGPPEVAVDTTGATADQGGTLPGANGPAAKPNTQATPGSGSQPATKPAEPPPPPTTIEVEGRSISVERGPVILLNPSTARQGSSIGVAGSGFDPGATVDLVVKRQENEAGDAVTFFQVDKSGTFGGINFTIPDTLSTGPFFVEARERKPDGAGYSKIAQVTGTVAGGSAQVKLGTQVGQPGNSVELSAKGFSPDEIVAVYWNSLESTAIGSFRSDGKGAAERAQIKVPYGAVGNNSFIFVGEKSQSPVTANFLMLSLFPSVELSSYALKADNVLNFGLKDFGPSEDILVYLNNPNGDPIATVQTRPDGTFSGGGGFLVPFVLRGQQTLIFIGQQSKAPATASFDILPYTPNAQPSTYGGRPGTTVTFYGSGFARNETVHVYTGRSKDSAGKEVACFATDERGNVGAGGQYVIPSDAPAGQLLFTMVASKSLASTTAAIEVMASDVPVQVPPQGEFTCTLDQNLAPAGQTQAPQTQAPPASPTRPAPTQQQNSPPQQQTAPPQQQTAPPQNQTAPAQQPSPAQPSQPPATQQAPTQPPQPQPTQPQQGQPPQPVTPQQVPAQQAQQPNPEPAKPAATTATPVSAPAPAPSPSIYQVQAGETLSQIAQEHGTTVDAIVQANGIQDPNLIRIGQELLIPAAPKSSAPSSTTRSVRVAMV